MLISGHPKRHQWVGRALMLKQHIQVRIAAAYRSREQHIGVPVPQRIIDERSVLAHKAIQIHVPDQLGRHYRPQLRPRMVGIAEHRPKQRIMRLPTR